MKIGVSACLIGMNTKYNGGNNLNTKVVEFLKDKEVPTHSVPRRHIHSLRKTHS